MAEFVLRVENNLIVQKRGINVYLHSTKSSHIISHTSSIVLPLQKAEQDDYLHISVVSGPGNLEKSCIIAIPGWIDFQFFSQGSINIFHKKENTLLEIPPGPPAWQLKITCPSDSEGLPTEGLITIRENRKIPEL